MRIGIEFDDSNLKAKLMRIKADVKGASVLGMREAMKEFHDDALNKPPTVPEATGWLRSHHRTGVLRILGVVTGYLETYSTPYAAVVHEGIRKGSRPFMYGKPGSGPKWIQAKLIRNHMKYIRIATRQLRRVLR